MYKALLATVLDHRKRRENTNSPTDCFEESRLLLSLGLLEEAVQSAKKA
jgi:hypothetical protein